MGGRSDHGYRNKAPIAWIRWPAAVFDAERGLSARRDGRRREVCRSAGAFCRSSFRAGSEMDWFVIRRDRHRCPARRLGLPLSGVLVFRTQDVRSVSGTDVGRVDDIGGEYAICQNRCNENLDC